MLDIAQAENQRFKSELSSLRQLILEVEPSVMLDGRFEKMMLSPITVIEVARNLIQKIHQLRDPK
jgi:hypothetical protein